MAQTIPNPANPRQCAPRERVVIGLAVKHGETHQFTVISGAIVFEFLMNTQTTTWSLIATQANGISCMIAAGQGIIVGSRASPPGRPG